MQSTPHRERRTDLLRVKNPLTTKCACGGTRVDTTSGMPAAGVRYCVVLELRLRAVEDREEILDRFVLFGQTTTSIVRSSPVARRPLPLDA